MKGVSLVWVGICRASAAGPSNIEPHSWHLCVKLMTVHDTQACHGTQRTSDRVRVDAQLGV